MAPRTWCIGWLPRVVVAAAVMMTTTLSGAGGVARADAASPLSTSQPTSSTRAGEVGGCEDLSPIAIPCVGLGKFADAVAAECRRVGVPEVLCTIPLSHEVTQAARDAYLRSWVHRTARFQYQLGNTLPLREAQWLGTHNSFNSLSKGFTLSHADSNQQLSLRQQLDIDVRSIELDLHYIPQLDQLGARQVTVCHGQPPGSADLGCTTEPSFASQLPQLARWLNVRRNAHEVVLLYLEDALDNRAAYASTIDTLDRVLRGRDGRSLIYRPDRAQRASNGCTPLPLELSRKQVRATGARVVVVGSCAPGWSADVFDWTPAHVEGGTASTYRSFPGCDRTYRREVYASRLVRYFEDSTLVSVLLDPTRAPLNPEALTPRRVQEMTSCGVNLYGFDQLLPEDGRIQASLWSWAPDEPRAGAGRCALQRTGGRWVSAPCRALHRAGCERAGTWRLSAQRVRFSRAPAACAALGAEFSLPRSGEQNARLRSLARGVGGTWVRHVVR